MVDDSDGGADTDALARQVEAATEAFRAAALRLLQEGDVDPRLIVLAAAAVTGELAAGTARAAEEDADGVLGDVLETVREAARQHGAVLELATGPAAGSA